LNGRIVWLSGEKLEDLFEEEERSEKELFGEEFFAEKLFGKEWLESTKFSEKNISD
jgi:hypothetical protein